METFSDYEIKVLRYIKKHKVRSESAGEELPLRFLKVALFLIDRGDISDKGAFLELSQPAKEAIAQKNELEHGVVIRDFVLGFLAGIVSTLSIECLFFLL